MTDKKTSKQQRPTEIQLDVFETAFEDKKAELAANLKNIWNIWTKKNALYPNADILGKLISKTETTETAHV